MNLLKRRGVSLMAVGALALLGGVAAPAAANAADVLDDPIRFDTGHIDAFNITLNDDDTPRLVLKEDVTGSHVMRTPESVELFVKEDAQTTVPEGFLPGLPSEVYHLPLTQDSNLIWPGWDTNALAPVYGADASTDFVVDVVDAPGDVYLWTQDVFGGPASLMADGSFTLPGSIQQPYTAHTHANWAFTEPGTYTLDVHGEVTSADGDTEVSTNTATYTFLVGEESIVPAAEITGLSHHYHQNTPIALDLETNVADAQVNWFVQRTDQDEPVANADAAGTEFQLTAEQALDGAQVSAQVIDTEGDVLVAAAPVIIEVDDHGADPLQQVTVSGVADHYHTGDAVELAASVHPASVLERWDWFVQGEDDAEPTAIDGEHSSELSLEAGAELDGAEVFAQLSFNDGAHYVDSDAVTVRVNDHHDHEDEDDHDAPTVPAEDLLDGVAEGGISVTDPTPTAGDTVTVEIAGGDVLNGEHVALWMFSEPTLLSDGWATVAADGTVSGVIPADAAGEHRLAVIDEADAVLGWQTITVAAADAGEAGSGTAEAGSGAGEAGTEGSGSGAGEAGVSKTEAGGATDAKIGAALATTGADLTVVSAAGVLLLIAGAGVVVLARRRSANTA